MAQLTWDRIGDRIFETGVDRGVLYLPDNAGNYEEGYAWNGLTAVNETPTGAEPTALYADNIKYLNLLSTEELGVTIEAYTYPDEFAQCDGTAVPVPGMLVGQQARKLFGLSYRTKIGNDVDGNDHAYKLHLLYGALAAPSERSYATVNDTPEAITFSWEATTTPVEVPNLKPTSLITIDSRTVDAAGLAALEQALYGTAGTDPRLPLPLELISMLGSSLTVAVPLAPTAVGNVVTIPSVTGVIYRIGSEVVTGNVTITEDVIVNAVPAPGYTFPAVTDNDWYFAHSD